MHRTEIEEQLPRWVANFLGGKVRELRFQLSGIVRACDESLLLFGRGLPVPEDTMRAVVFGFSAFANVVQTLKDGSEKITGRKLAWSRVKQQRHGAFVRDARNAATHDGNPVVNAWADGRFFVSGDIYRLDDKGRVVEIPRPSEDIRTICLEFSLDYCEMLRGFLSDAEGSPHLTGHPFSLSEVEEAMRSPMVPEFAKRLFDREKATLTERLAAVEFDPVGKAIRELDETVRYCREASSVRGHGEF